MKTSAFKLNALLAAFCLIPSVPMMAQRPWIQPVESPVVHPDRTVTFNFIAETK